MHRTHLIVIDISASIDSVPGWLNSVTKKIHRSFSEVSDKFFDEIISVT